MQQAAPTRREPGAEPIPGYQLLEPLGTGGFGEVWKCQAPGGLAKAIKFVHPGHEAASPADQELAALERVKALRHPFILSLERIEVVDGVLIIVSELADQNLLDLHREYRDQGQPGIPRDELLSYLAEAAEALDWMYFEHGLQHLDVKPHNLFLVSGHVKVADFGLVRSLGPEGDGAVIHQNGATPLYSAPELLRGSLSRHSDQYSLAVVYQQLLTGEVPFWNDNVYDLMMLHLSAPPDVSALSESDRPIITRALAKIPEQRYASCLQFVQALLGDAAPAPVLRRSGIWRRVLVATPDEAATANLAATPRAPSAVTLHGDCDTVRPAPPAPPSGNPAPTAVTLPGYRFLNCLGQGPLGDLWRAEDDQGRPRRALCVLNFIRYDARLIAHLQALHDSALPPTEVRWSPAERLVVLTEWKGMTLRDRFEQCQMHGQPGIPRGELLRLMRSAATALDGLHARHGLQHLYYYSVRCS